MIHTMCMLCCVPNVLRAYLVHIVCARPTVVAVVLIRRSMCMIHTIVYVVLCA